MGAPELAEGLLDRTCGVETLSQQQDTKEEEKGRQAVDHVLEVFDTEERYRKRSVKRSAQSVLNSGDGRGVTHKEAKTT